MAKKTDGDGAKKKKLPLVPIVLVIVGLVVGVGVAKTVLASPAPAPASAAGTPPTTKKPGEIATIDSMNVNLAGNHYLRIGVGVQLAAGPVAKDWTTAHGAKVRDVVIGVFSGRSMQELDTADGREAARDQLKAQLTAEPGPGEPENDVIDVYLTDFVMR